MSSINFGDILENEKSEGRERVSLNNPVEAGPVVPGEAIMNQAIGVANLSQMGLAVTGADVNPKIGESGTFFFEREVPLFVEAAMENLYGSFFSSIKKISADRDLQDVSTYVSCRHGKITSIFLFRLEKNRAEVLNEVITLSEEAISQFSGEIFSRYPSIVAISFHAIQVEMSYFRFPYQKLNCSEDFILALPDSVGEYLEKLGTSTRRNLKYNLKRVSRKFPSFCCNFYHGNEVKDQHVRDILKLHSNRMAYKHKIFTLDEVEIDRVLAMVRTCDCLVSVAEIDGVVCGGSISFRSGKNYFLSVISHDSAYNLYSIGIICCYLMICECIARNGVEFHFQWGKSDYKMRLRGVQHDLYSVHVFRNRMQKYLQVNLLLSNVLKSNVRKVKLILLEARTRNSWLSNAVVSTMHLFRKLRLRQAGR